MPIYEAHIDPASLLILLRNFQYLSILLSNISLYTTFALVFLLKTKLQAMFDILQITN